MCNVVRGRPVAFARSVSVNKPAFKENSLLPGTRNKTTNVFLVEGVGKLFRALQPSSLAKILAYKICKCKLYAYRSQVRY